MTPVSGEHVFDNHYINFTPFRVSTVCYSMCSRSFVTVRPVANIQEDAACTSLLRYHHQGVTSNATTLDCHYTQSPKAIHNTEDVTKTSPTEETASNAPSTSELAIIFHRPLPIALKRPPPYPIKRWNIRYELQAVMYKLGILRSSCGGSFYFHKKKAHLKHH